MQVVDVAAAVGGAEAATKCAPPYRIAYFTWQVQPYPPFVSAA